MKPDNTGYLARDESRGIAITLGGSPWLSTELIFTPALPEFTVSAIAAP